VLVRRIRPALVIALGMVFVAIGFGMIALIGTNSLALVVIGNTILSVGFGFTFTLTSDMIITTAPPERAGAASAISETSNELGGSLGIAILGSLGLAIYRSQIAANVPASIPAEAVKSAQETLGGALAIYTKSGSQYPGGSIETYGGSFGRKGATMEYGGNVGFVDDFFVRSTSRRCGLGTTMLQELRAHCLAIGIRALFVEVAPDNEPAIGLWFLEPRKAQVTAAAGKKEAPAIGGKRRAAY
jgi:GNAT superfamily N-acetyltransferase